ncbi:MAG: hypothetical protein AAGI15_10785 [Pseudomonadota bacterium]
MTAKALMKSTLAGASIAIALTFSGVAQAEYRLSAFENARGYEALDRMDLEQASSRFSYRPSMPMDYADLNNLCVLRIMQRELPEAIATCEQSLRRVSDKPMGLRNKRRTRAVILGNLAVAQAIAGDVTSATETLERAGSLDSDNPNISANRRAFARNQVAAN